MTIQSINKIVPIDNNRRPRSRERKTIDTWEIQQWTQYGWECVNTELSYRDARRSTKEYRDNQPGQYRIMYRRERIQ